MTNNKHITDLHKEITEWKSNIEFTRDELKTYQNRLAEVAAKNNETEVMAEVEKYQNKFIRQFEVADELFHDLKIKDANYAELVKSNPVASDRRLTDDHVELRDKVETYVKLYSEDKSNFNSFISKWL
jgi:hypothetical protein